MAEQGQHKDNKGSEYFREIGRKGGNALKAKHGREGFRLLAQASILSRYKRQLPSAKARDLGDLAF
jgi:hypothetical protein